MSRGVTGGKVNNFPPFFPITYHSIEDDIPPHQRTTMRLLLYVFFLTLIGLWFNWLAMTALWLGVSQFLWSALYAVIGTWGAWNGWYKSAYAGFQNDSTTRFFCFFLWFAAHCGFSIFVTVGLSYDSTAVVGIITLIDFTASGSPVYTKDGAQQTFAVINVILWLVISLVSVAMLGKMRKEYGDKGRSGAAAVGAAGAGMAASAAVSSGAFNQA